MTLPKLGRVAELSKALAKGEWPAPRLPYSPLEAGFGTALWLMDTFGASETDALAAATAVARAVERGEQRKWNGSE